VKPAYPFYVEVARAQLEDPKKRLEKRTLERMVLKGEPEDRTIEGELKRAMKILEGLVTGEGKAPQDKDELTDAAFNAVRDRLHKIESARQLAKLSEQAAKLGLKLA
jgi:hypothetical protein